MSEVIQISILQRKLKRSNKFIYAIITSQKISNGCLIASEHEITREIH
jgi:hypothetical protein